MKSKWKQNGKFKKDKRKNNCKKIKVNKGKKKPRKKAELKDFLKVYFEICLKIYSIHINLYKLKY